MTIGLAATATHAVNPWLYAKMPYDAGKDFAGITQMVRVPNVLVMNAARAEQLKIHSVADLIAYAKANPGKLNYGRDRKSTRLNSSHQIISYAVFCLQKKRQYNHK